VFCVSVKVKLAVLLLCVCVHSAWKGRPQNDPNCVGWDVKLYSLTHPTNGRLFMIQNGAWKSSIVWTVEIFYRARVLLY